MITTHHATPQLIGLNQEETKANGILTVKVNRIDLLPISSTVFKSVLSYFQNRGFKVCSIHTTNNSTKVVYQFKLKK